MIHPSAHVSPEADISPEAEIGAFVVVEGRVTVAPGCHVLPGAQLLGPLTIGPGTTIGRAAVIGELPQDLKFDPETPSSTEIGAGNVIREHVTIHRGAKAGGVTRLGDNNFLMVGAHLGHDVQIGQNNVIANAALFGGHVVMGDNNFIGGSAVFHQFTRVGDYCMVQGLAGFSKDLAPFSIGSGVNRLGGINVIGLKRAGFTTEQRAEIKEIFTLVLLSDLNFSQAVETAEARAWSPAASRFLEFVKARSAKGVCRLLN